MKTLFLTFTLLISSFTLYSQIEEELCRAELNFNVSTYNSLSASIEKEFRYNDWYFGPRVEVMNPFGLVRYNTEKGEMTMRAQLRIQPLRLEWEKNQRIRFGISPFWMLGPIPRQGFYQVNTSIWTSIRLTESKRIEAGLNTAKEIPFQVSFRQEL